jgi:MerR family transcriptional regulator, light-induced transcriptional regulator
LALISKNPDWLSPCLWTTIRSTRSFFSSFRTGDPVLRLLTPKQVAQAINVSESSLKRWCDQGLMTAVRTAGGHRRLALDEVIQFLRQSGHPLVRPELLGLPSNTGQAAIVAERAREQVRDALVDGDEQQCRRLVFDLYLAGLSACEICDRVLALAFHDIGIRWEGGEVTVYRERRACEIAFKMLHELRMVVRAPVPESPVAVGGTLSCDPYQLPNSMIELVLRELGWQATSLGTGLPAGTIGEAVRDSRPRMLWLSVSYIDSVPAFLRDYAQLHSLALEAGAAVVVGGRALTTEIRQQMAYSAYCDMLRHLATFTSSLASKDVKRNPKDESDGWKPRLKSTEHQASHSRTQKRKDR